MALPVTARAAMHRAPLRAAVSGNQAGRLQATSFCLPTALCLPFILQTHHRAIHPLPEPCQLNLSPWLLACDQAMEGKMKSSSMRPCWGVARVPIMRPGELSASLSAAPPKASALWSLALAVRPRAGFLLCMLEGLFGAVNLFSYVKYH